MWHSRPPRDPPPLHGKYHLKIPFWLFEHLPYVGYLETSLWLDQLDHPDYPIHPINLTILTTLATLLHQPDQLFVSFPNPFALSEAENLSDQLYTQIDTSF